MYSNIYIVCSSKALSGGAESLHQLCYILRKYGKNAYIFYFDAPDKRVDEKFNRYNIQTCKWIEDNSENLVILPEVIAGLRRKFKYCKVAIWWLSLDYYNKTKPFRGTVSRCYDRPYLFFIFPVLFVFLLATKRTTFYTWKEDNRITMHFYNCERIYQYLKKQGVSEEKLHYLCGPINADFYKKNVENIKEIKKYKQNMVLYNPKKGMQYTKKIIKRLKQKNIRVLPLENMDRQQMIAAMEHAKIYMDFGYFPGPERIPREAVMLGCNIITSKSGCARNDVDVPIPAQYKFDKKSSNVKQIVEKIEDMMTNYEQDYPDFEQYREKVFLQQEFFNKGIRKYLLDENECVEIN